MTYPPRTPGVHPDSTPNRRITRLGWCAVGLGLLGFLLAAIPQTSIWSGILLVAAFVLSIIVLARRIDRAWPGVVGLVLSVLGSGAAIAMAIITATGLLFAPSNIDRGQLVPDSSDTPPVTWTVSGSTGTSTEGLTVTLTSISCGQQLVPDVAPEGQYCVATATLDNTGELTQQVQITQFNAIVSSVRYRAVASASTLGEHVGSAQLLPGESLEARVVFDVPVRESPDAISYTTASASGGVATIPVE